MPVAVGCSLADAAPSERTASEEGAASPVADPTAKSWALRKPLDQFTGKEFDQWVKSKNGPPWQENPITVERKCSGNSDCENGSKKTKVRYEAVVEAKLLSLDHMPKYGVVVARFSVDGPWFGDAPPEAIYGFKNEKYDYYLVVEPSNEMVDGAKVGRWKLVEVVDKTDTSSVVKQGRFKRCPNSTNWEPTFSYVAFTSCMTQHQQFHDALIQLQESRSGPIKLQELRPFLVGDESDSPAWISCIHGCCIAETDS